MAHNAKESIVGAIVEWLSSKLDAAAFQTVKTLASAIVEEHISFPRSGNFTDYRRDSRAFASAKVEPLVGRDGKFALTVSAMEGRLVTDTIAVVLNWLAEGLFPEVDGKTPRARRASWVKSLGCQLSDAGCKFGKRPVFSDDVAALAATLESIIPEKFEGTEYREPKVAHVNLISPAKLGGLSLRLSIPLSSFDAYVLAAAKLVKAGKFVPDLTTKDGAFKSPFHERFGASLAAVLEKSPEQAAA